jgi:hypothetical protein
MGLSGIERREFTHIQPLTVEVKAYSCLIAIGGDADDLDYNVVVSLPLSRELLICLSLMTCLQKLVPLDDPEAHFT